MKRSAIIIAAFLSGAMLLASCEKEPTVPVDGTPEANAPTAAGSTEEAAGGTKADEKKAEASASDITAAIMAEIEFSAPIEKNIDNIGAFYDVDTASITDMSAFVCGSGADPDELAVFRFTDESSAKAGMEAVQVRLDSQLALYKDYTPDQVYKLEEAVLFEKDGWVIFAACSDNARAKEIAEGLI